MAFREAKWHSMAYCVGEDTLKYGKLELVLVILAESKAI
jgi:hypothetical protein